MRNSIAVLLVVMAILVGSGATYFVRNGQTVTTTTTVTSPASTSKVSLFSQSTTFTTVTRTTLSFGGSTYVTTTGEYSGCIPPVQCYLTTVTAGINSSTQTSPNLFNETYDVYVNYSSAWGLSYQTRLGINPSSGIVIESGNFFGHSPANASVTITENSSLLDDYGYITCFQAEKLDNSSSLLILGIASSNSKNQTSLPFGSASLCAANVYTGGQVGYSSQAVCTETYYQVLARVSVSVGNTTTQTLGTITTTLTREDTFTTTTNTTQSIGYVTTNGSYEPPSTSVIEVCTYVG